MNKIVLSYVILPLIFNQFLMVQCNREHKVHNIVLYPDKHSWCKTTVIKQVISYPGCTSIEINNKVCVGACFSYSIPQTEPSDQGEVIVPYCDSCQPSESTWRQVSLECNADTPHQLIKNVQIIQNCSCNPCHKDRLQITQFSTDSDDFLLHTNVDTEMLDRLHLYNQTKANDTVESVKHWEKMQSFLNMEILTTLKNIQVNNTDKDKEKLFRLFNIIKEPQHQTKNITNFIEVLSQNVTDLDTKFMAEILLKFEKKRNLKTDDMINDKVQQDNGELITVKDRGSSSVVGKREVYDPAIPLWIRKAFNLKNKQINTSLSSDEAVLDEIPHLYYYASHENLQQSNFDKAPPVAVKIPENKENSMVKSLTEDNVYFEPQNIQRTPQHHYINENVSGHSHLTRGPHGALVIESDQMHEKLVDVIAHELKPNHAGTLLSYQSHSSENDSQK